MRAGGVVVLDVGALVPACYAAFRPLVAEGLRYFVDALPTARRAELVRRQAALGPAASLEARARALLEGAPLLHKLGQVLARHPALDHALRERLQELESLPATLTVAELAPLVSAELGAAADAIELGAQPLAEGSVAVVMPFTLRQPRAGLPAAGVLKILKPGIEARISEDLDIAHALAAHLEARSAALGLPPLAYGETIAQVAALLRAEIEPTREREHLARAADLYAAVPGVRVPRLLPFHGKRMTAMERIDAHKITDGGFDAAGARRLAERLVEVLLARPFFSARPDAPFHGDPHAGNVLLDGDGNIVIIDWSLAGSLREDARRALAQVLIGALILSRRRVRAGLRGLLEPPLDEALLTRSVDEAMDAIPWRGLPGFAWLLALLDRLALGGARFAADFTLFRKALFTLNGVFSDISDDFSVDAPIAQTAVLQFYRDLVPRLLLPGRRRFGIPLSNLELATLALSWPLTATRYWYHGLRTAGRRIAQGGR